MRVYATTYPQSKTGTVSVRSSFLDETMILDRNPPVMF